MDITRFFLLLLIAAVAPFSALAKDDPVLVNKIEFKKLQASDIPSSSGQWTRIEVVLDGKFNPDEKSNNAQWIRNIEVILTLVYQDEKAQDKNSPESLLVMKSKVRLFAIKVAAKTSAVFYIPAEAFPIYRLRPEPYAYSIDLSVCGTKVELTKDNVKSLLSKRILRAGDPKKVYDNYLKLVQSAASANEKVLMSLPEAPLNVQRYEYDKAKDIPTYLLAN